jgi:hypothetical protein
MAKLERLLLADEKSNRNKSDRDRHMQLSRWGRVSARRDGQTTPSSDRVLLLRLANKCLTSKVFATQFRVESVVDCCKAGQVSAIIFALN